MIKFYLKFKKVHIVVFTSIFFLILFSSKAMVAGHKQCILRQNMFLGRDWPVDRPLDTSDIESPFW